MTDPRVEVDAGEVLHAAWPLLDDDDNRGLDALLAHASPSPYGRRRVVLEERDGGVVVLGLEGAHWWCRRHGLTPIARCTCSQAERHYRLLLPAPASDPAMEENDG